MLQIRTVLCPVDFSVLNARELDLAVEICRAFGARLILHHNVGNAPPQMAASWMWHQEHRNGYTPEELASAQLGEMLAALPREVRPEARLSNGLAVPAILQVEDQVHADLVVLATHGASTDDHTSVSEQIIERSRCPVLVLHGLAEPVLHLAAAENKVVDVLVPTDFSPAAKGAVLYSFELARRLPLRLHLLHVIPPRKSAWIETGVSMGQPQVRAGRPTDEARDRLAALVPEDLETRVSVHVEIGEPTEVIADLAAGQGVSCIVMGAHARSFLRRLFTADTSREVLHRADCPVWFVPETAAA
jgi:nucleotide-binding universal stress UspA family protein